MFVWIHHVAMEIPDHSFRLFLKFCIIVKFVIEKCFHNLSITCLQLSEDIQNLSEILLLHINFLQKHFIQNIASLCIIILVPTLAHNIFDFDFQNLRIFM